MLNESTLVYRTDKVSLITQLENGHTFVGCYNCVFTKRFEESAERDEVGTALWSHVRVVIVVVIVQDPPPPGDH